MAQQQKKTETKKSTTRSAPARQPAKQTAAPVKTYGGTGTAVAILLMLVLALLMFIGFFAGEAFLLGPLCDGVKYLFGAGFFVVPFVLIYLAMDLLLHFKRRKKYLRLVTVALIPFFVGAVIHIFTAEDSYSSLSALLEDALVYRSGGFLSGGLSAVLISAITRVGAGFVVILLLVLDVLYALNITISRLAESAGDKLEQAKGRSDEQRAYRREERRRQRAAEAAEQEAMAAKEREGNRPRPAVAVRDPESKPSRPIDMPLDRKQKIDIPLDGYGNAPSGAFAAPKTEAPATAATATPAAPSASDAARGNLSPVKLSGDSDVTVAPPQTFAMPETLRQPAAPAAPAKPAPAPEKKFTVPTLDPTPAVPAEESLPETPVFAPVFKPTQTAPAAAKPAATATRPDPEELPLGVGGGFMAPPVVKSVAPPPAILNENHTSDLPPLKDEEPAEKSARERMKVSMTAAELENEIAQVSEQAADTAHKDYVLPPIELLKTEPPKNMDSAEAEMRQNAEKLTHTLSSFNIDAQIVGVTRGPTVTRYEVQLSDGIRSSRLTALADDIALSLAAQSVRIAPIPNKSAIGIEVPNKVTTTVFLRDVLESKEFRESKSQVTFALGHDIAGNPIVSDIARLPHMLVGGTTNSGKSVCINSLLISLIYKSTPDEVRLILIDPKMVEFASYNGIPHLLIPVVTDPKKAAGALQWAVMEMLQRYKRFNELGVRNFTEYNEACDRFNAAAAEEAAAAAATAGEAEENDVPFDLEDEPAEKSAAPAAPAFEKMARIVIVIDELADLMIASPGEVEESICRIAQMARAAGMHLIVATQRPSADVITGLMKANIPSRIAFSVASGLESRIILDQIGAERLIGRGDMLFAPIGVNKPVRIQGCLVTSPEIDAVVEYVKGENQVEYSSDVIAQIDRNAANAGTKKGKGGAAREDSGEDEGDEDELFNDAVSIAVENGRVSTSMLQSRLKLGYARAARIVDQMESRGIIGPFEGQKPRQILISKEEWAEMRYRREGRDE